MTAEEVIMESRRSNTIGSAWLNQLDEIEDALATDQQVGGTHYNNKAIQPIDYIQQNNLPYCEGNIIKYVTRHKEKNGAEDIRKAIHYLRFILAYEYNEAL